ncbi:nucleotide sugar dehydrogenase [Janibacter limosus]|uniref:Nucleotide sugar dehydrogenase n=1 Tax=Janibacter limosus TaxID=53458 RepID=A0AC61U544_9MICO|nr:nucleotide sugar dehydrogenase [Janibacter limosus]UUZ45103.1 nucleotide sugar dehydrogenase [Janibacter limosus]
MSMDVAIIGRGYVGLPLALEASRVGVKVLGFDINEGVVKALNSGVSHIDDLSDDDIRAMLDAGFEATTDPSRLDEVKTIIICVPTPLSEDGGPDLGPINSAVKTISEHLHAGQTIVLESTTYPGTTDEVVRPALEAGGLVAGKDFFLAFSPERIDPGNEQYGAKNTPKVVGGHTPACGDAAAAFYGQFVDTVVRAKGTREAETAKLPENTYRHINIAPVNEMARFCHDLDIDLWDVINAAKTKPFGFRAFYPGPGVGGHCIPIDPNYLSYNVRAKLGYPFRFVELAQEINATMPAYVVQRAQNILNEDSKSLRGSTVLLLGVTYKPDIADQRESPAVPPAQQLLAKGASVQYFDAKVMDWKAVPEAARADDLDAAVAAADLTVLVQNHKTFDVEALAGKSQRFFDTRGVAEDSDKVERL